MELIKMKLIAIPLGLFKRPQKHFRTISKTTKALQDYFKDNKQNFKTISKTTKSILGSFQRPQTLYCIRFLHNCIIA